VCISVVKDEDEDEIVLVSEKKAEVEDDGQGTTRLPSVVQQTALPEQILPADNGNLNLAFFPKDLRYC
jgi:hypothetical protein